MLKRIIGSSLARFVVFSGLLAGALAGCDRAENSLYGELEVISSGVRAAACEAPVSGHLQLDGIEVADVVTISAEDLCHQWIVRRDLPAGLYTVSWQPSDDADDRPSWEVRSEGIVNVFPGQTTTLRVLTVEPEPKRLSQAEPNRLTAAAAARGL